MNCQELQRILDERELAELSVADQRELKRHASACADCEAALAAHDAVRAVAVPPMPAAFEQRLRRLVAAQVAVAPASRRAFGRPWLVVGLLGFGVAAATVVGLQFSGNAGNDASGADAARPASIAGEVDAPAGFRPAEPRENGAAGAGAAITAADAGGNAGEPAPTADPVPGRFTVAVSPLRQQATDPEAIRLSEVVYAALLDELRRIPNLELIALDAADVVDTSVTIQSPAAVSFEGGPASQRVFSISPNGAAEPIAGERTLVLVDSRAALAGGNGEPVVVGTGTAPVSLETIPTALSSRIESITSGTAGAVAYTGGGPLAADGDPAAGVVNVVLLNNVAGIRVDLSQTDGGFDSVPVAAGQEPMPYDFRLDVASAHAARTWSFSVSGRARSPAARFSFSAGASPGEPVEPLELAQQVIAQLQENLLPPDDSVVAGIELEVLDTTRSTEDRLAALSRLRRVEGRKDDERPIGSDIVAAVLALVPGASPEQRASIWRLLRDTNDPLLLPALGNAVRYETSDAARLEAAVSLSRFGDEPSVRAALELAARTDAAANIRQFASWATRDEAGWREHIVASLFNSSQSDAERLAPLLFEPRNYEGIQAAPASLGPALDSSVAGELAALIARQPDEAVRVQLLVRLAREDHPALTPLFLERLNADDSDRVRLTAVTALRRWIDEPAVRYGLERAAADDVSGRLRTVVETVLANGSGSAAAGTEIR